MPYKLCIRNTMPHTRRHVNEKPNAAMFWKVNEHPGHAEEGSNQLWVECAGRQL